MPSLLVRLLAVLLERLEATNSQQLYCHVGMLEAVKSEHTLRNVGYRIFFFNFLCFWEMKTGSFELKIYFKESKQHVESLCLSWLYRFYLRLIA